MARVYEVMKSYGGSTIAKYATLTPSSDISKLAKEKSLSYLVVPKPVRGRGSHGVKLNKDEEMPIAHPRYFFDEHLRSLSKNTSEEKRQR